MAEQSPDPTTGEIPVVAPPIPGTSDLSRYLTELGGKPYLECKWREYGLRTDHPDAIIETRLERLEGGMAVFMARVAIPGGGSASGWGSETEADFVDYIEKAETKAKGRAYAALGYGTQFCEDSNHPSEAGGNGGGGDRRQGGRNQMASAAQVRLIFGKASRELHWHEDELEERCLSIYGRRPDQLTKREASEFIDYMDGGANGQTPASHQPTADAAGAIAKEEAAALDAVGLPLSGAGIETILRCRRELLRVKPQTWAIEDRARNLEIMKRHLTRTNGCFDLPSVIALCCAVTAITWGPEHLFKTDRVLDEMPVSVIDLLTRKAGWYPDLLSVAQSLRDNWLTA